MFQADISPRPMMSVDIFTTVIEEQVGAAPFCASSTARANIPAVTALRHGLVQAIRATATNTATIPLVGAEGSGSAIVVAPRAITTGAASIPAAKVDATVNAVRAPATGMAKPVAFTGISESVSVLAPRAIATAAARSPIISSETVLTTEDPGFSYTFAFAFRGGVGTSNMIAIAPVVTGS